VVTELEVAVGDNKKPKQLANVALTGGVSDFNQTGFSAEQVIDGKPRDQGGWAVSGSTVHAHWAVFQIKTPVSTDGSKDLVVRLHQFHNADKHRLGRFRISFTTSKTEKLPLGLAEPYRAALSVAADKRSEADKQLLTGYFDSIDPSVKADRDALAASKAAVPADPEVVALQAKLERAKQPVAVDLQLERLRADVAQSETQIKNDRLTAAEDLVWALINSPGFLFNR
ncbi:MAG: hypothetical protein ACO1RT_04355, partial [Planctomycetaceae bacterium]